ncbi:MAG: hypothetical protein ICV78_13650 [Tolypothrix sp. Co-bin9]|nr:hypothetical protein [Tolypothrix sp. Co-bin9]
MIFINLYLAPAPLLLIYRSRFLSLANNAALEAEPLQKAFAGLSDWEGV